MIPLHKFREFLSNASDMLFYAAGKPETGTMQEFACAIIGVLAEDYDWEELFLALRDNIDTWEKELKEYGELYSDE